jgi:transcriptional regulator with XRE-family HTH domain
MAALGARIRELRQEQHLTLRGFARAVDVAPSFVVDIEADRRLPSPATLYRIATALGVPLGDLQALDPRLAPEEREALRLALAADWDALENHLASLDDHWLEVLQQAAKMLDAATAKTLIRRHS